MQYHVPSINIYHHPQISVRHHHPPCTIIHQHLPFIIICHIPSCVIIYTMCSPHSSPVAGSRTSKSSLELLFNDTTRWPSTKCNGSRIAADPVATERLPTDCSSEGTLLCQHVKPTRRAIDFWSNIRYPTAQT